MVVQQVFPMLLNAQIADERQIPIVDKLLLIRHIFQSKYSKTTFAIPIIFEMTQK